MVREVAERLHSIHPGFPWTPKPSAIGIELLEVLDERFDQNVDSRLSAFWDISPNTWSIENDSLGIDDASKSKSNKNLFGLLHDLQLLIKVMSCIDGACLELLGYTSLALAITVDVFALPDICRGSATEQQNRLSSD